MDAIHDRGRHRYRLELSATRIREEGAGKTYGVAQRPVDEVREPIEWPLTGAVFVQGIANGKPVHWDPEAKAWIDDQGLGYAV